jgi:hypothetical protein
VVKVIFQLVLAVVAERDRAARPAHLDRGEIACNSVTGIARFNLELLDLAIVEFVDDVLADLGERAEVLDQVLAHSATRKVRAASMAASKWTTMSPAGNLRSCKGSHAVPFVAEISGGACERAAASWATWSEGASFGSPDFKIMHQLGASPSSDMHHESQRSRCLSNVEPWSNCKEGVQTPKALRTGCD